MTRGLKPSTITPGTSPVVTVPPPPAYLSKDAKAEWRRVAPILILERKVVTFADMGALENYCIALGTMRELHRLLQVEGHVSASGKRHPASTALIQAQQMQLRAAGELGLTPSARSRAVMMEADDEEGLDL
ncbi:P27 family predicted phage terminase small subunit [Rhizobium sp. PP-F2F-G48]|uniref:phage terminase small subunit P27 family n=1 Tax=Rhizobium sp. PP-F2F-G48 TaxID=2135651 RepID=UPI001049142D|nr:phage terminase small subunit P27 family [Rhizobium sp. PP-F2F-G48]TCM57825.1 P27 family predicted phage terminase small subunit [Rhizobium sp. PP-F2F-G48]